MMTQRIDDELKTALKEKNEITISALRNLKAALKNAEIAAQTKSGRASTSEAGREKLSEEDILKVIAKQVKQHKDSIEGFTAGGRQDLVEHEQAQMRILEQYLPAQMTHADLEKIVQETIQESKATTADFGKVMKVVMSKVAGRADGSLVTKLVKENLK